MWLERHFLVIAVIAGLLYGALAVIYLGLDPNWDLRNYHIYIGYAFLNDRLTYDLAPAQMQSYFNPLLDAVYYAIYASTSASTVSVIFGAFHGLQLTFLALIGVYVFDGEKPSFRYPTALLMGLLGCMGVLFNYEVGGASHDLVVSVAFLAALYAILRAYDTTRGTFALKGLVFGGLLMGFGIGAKYTGVMYGIGLLLAVALHRAPLRTRAVAIFATGMAMLVGMLATSGFWMVTMYREFGNPLFPLFPAIFPSEFIQLSGSEPGRGFSSMAQRLFAPIVGTGEPRRISHFVWQDFRLAFSYIILLAALAAMGASILNRVLTSQRAVADFFGSRRYGRAELASHMLLATLVGLYVAWLAKFTVVRYAAGWEALVPLFLCTGLRQLGAPMRGAAALCAVFIIAITPFVGFVGTRPSFGDDFFQFSETDLSVTEDSLVVMTGLEGTSFVIPRFPASTRFVRVQLTVNWTDRQDISGYRGLRARARAMIDAHKGPLFVLFDNSSDKYATEPENTIRQLDQFGLARAAGSCRIIESDGKRRRIELCRLTRLK